jgi:copper chaperone
MGLETVVIQIDGMTCDHCVHAIQSALEELEGISHAEVSLEEETATVSYDPDWITPEDILDAIEEEGYTASL